MKECIFCKILKGEMKSEEIYETEDVLSFLDINPKAPGHALVIPKEHGEKLTDLDDEIVGKILIATKKIQKMIGKALNPDGFTIGLNEGEIAGQAVPHVHVNIIPRFENDGGSSIHSVVNNPPSEEVSEIATKIRKAK